MKISIPLAALLAAGAVQAQQQPAQPPVNVSVQVSVPAPATPPPAPALPAPPPPAPAPVFAPPPPPAPPQSRVRIVHLPPSETVAGVPLTLTAKVENGYLLTAFELHYRPRGGGWRTLPFGKDAQGGYAAIVEGKEVTVPSLEYYLTSRDEGRPDPQPRFASEERPHPVLVRGDAEEQERLARLAWHHGHTSSAKLSADYVSFGSVKGRDDKYYQIEASYQYRLLGTIEHIQLGVGTIRGDVPPPEAFNLFNGEPGRKTGFDYGYGELALNLTGQVGLTGRVFLGADELGFATGGAGMLRIGRETFAHVELGGQYIARVGYDASLRLAWDTVPGWPIGFSVHITNAPNAPVQPGATPDNPLTDKGAPAGIRALLDAGYELSPNVTLLFKGGYQARFSTAGGVTLGAGAQVEW